MPDTDPIVLEPVTLERMTTGEFTFILLGSAPKVISARSWLGIDAEQATFVQPSMVVLDASERWVCERDLGDPFNCYYIKNKKTGQYLVAGDVDNGCIYLQQPDGRRNAKWLIESVSNVHAPMYVKIRNVQHQNFILANNTGGISERLWLGLSDDTHSDRWLIRKSSSS